MTADLVARLGFVIEDRAGIRVLAWPDGGCRPATEEECAMWDALRSSGEAVAWRYRDDVRPGLPWFVCDDPNRVEQMRVDGGYDIEPLYLHPAAPASAPVEYEFEVWQDDSMQAGGSTTDFATAKDEADHYAMMYGQDGPVEVKFYERREITPPTSTKGG